MCVYLTKKNVHSEVNYAVLIQLVDKEVQHREDLLKRCLVGK